MIEELVTAFAGLIAAGVHELDPETQARKTREAVEAVIARWPTVPALEPRADAVEQARLDPLARESLAATIDALKPEPKE